MLSILIVLENTDNPPLLGTNRFASHALCTEFVGMWLSSFHMHSGTSLPKVLSDFDLHFMQIRTTCDHDEN